MSANLVWRRQCQTCLLEFPTDDDLARHIETYRSRAQALIIELQQALAHLGSNASDDNCDARGSDGDNDKNLSCPHPNCKNNPPYTQLRSLQRHYRWHVGCNIACPSCLEEFTIVRKYDVHLSRCLMTQADDVKKADARRKGRLLRRRAVIELEQKIASIPKNINGPIHEVRAITMGGEENRHETADSDLIGENMNMLPSHHNSNPQLYNPAPSCSTEALTAQSPTMSRNDFQFSTPGEAHNSTLTHRYPRGPALLSNPMLWSLALTTHPAYMAATGDASTFLYSEPEMSFQSNVQGGDVGLESLHGAPISGVGVP